MFENAGKKVKDIAMVLFAVELLGVIIVAIQSSRSYYSDEFDFWRFILIAGIGFVVSYVSVIAIVAFGELVENSNRCANALERMQHYVKNNSGASGIVSDSNVSKVEPIFRDESSSKPTDGVKSGFWVCPQCGKVNHQTVGTCGCGQCRV